MTDREFRHQLHRGIGSAIVELKQNNHREKYKEIVYRCCFLDIGYDTQTEGTKGWYLYSAISALKCEDEVLGLIEDKYLMRLSGGLEQQLTDILLVYIQNGHSKAEMILKNKYNQLKERLMNQKVFSHRYFEREQFEELMIVAITTGKWMSFKQCVDDAGSVIQARQDDLCSNYDWFLGRAEKQFGRNRVWKYLYMESAASSNVRAVVNAYKKTENSKNDYQANLRPVTLVLLLEETLKNPLTLRPYATIGYCLKFGREASQEELLTLAKYIEEVESDDAKAQLLWVFRVADYPLSIEFLVDLARSDNCDLRAAAISALRRLKNEQIHTLAIEFIESGDTEYGLDLLSRNWKKSDDPLIRRTILKSQRVNHSIQMSLRDIYTKHQSTACRDVLLHAYRFGDCSYCRSEIVKAMGKNGVLPDQILLECQYDSYAATRKYAVKKLKKSS